jgi:two-component system, LuxR family, sensor kinase FixL
MINLVRNAIEAIGGGGTVRGSVLIEARRTNDDLIEVRVADNGPGFPPELIENAFLPLTSTKAEGLGVGLSLSRSIIEAHGGQIWLTSSADGAAIRFTLPIANISQP